MAEKPLISTVTISYNGKKFLEDCLGSIFKEKGNFQVIFVDNGSTDKSFEFVKHRFGHRKNLKAIRLEKNIGPTEARNLAVKKSTGKYILILDNDTKIKPGWFKHIPKFFSKHRKAGVVQPKLITMGTKKFNYAGDYLTRFGFLSERARSQIDKGQFDYPERIFSFNTASAYFLRDRFLEIGGYDNDFFFYWEEPDLSFRTWLNGFEVWFDPQITVEHAYGTPAKDDNYRETSRHQQATYFGCRNMITTLIKNLSLKNLFITLPLNIFCWILISILFFIKGNFTRSAMIWKGFYENIIFIRKTIQKRKKIQEKRQLTDRELFQIVGAKQKLYWYLGKAFSYIFNLPF